MSNLWGADYEWLLNGKDDIFSPIAKVIDAYVQYKYIINADVKKFENVELVSEKKRSELFGDKAEYSNLIQLINDTKDEDIWELLGLAIVYPPDLYNTVRGIVSAGKKIIFINNTDGIIELASKFSENKDIFINRRVLFIIDKAMRGTYQGPEAAKKIYSAIKSAKGIELINLLFSSNVDATKNLHNLFEVTFEEETMACIKKNFFERDLKNILFYIKILDLYNSKIKGTKMVLDKPFLNLNTVEYIIKSANKEGESPVDHLLEWFENSVKHEVEELQIENRNLLQKYINNIQSMGTELKFDEELLKLGRNDVFDDYVNKKYLTLAPGDVFIIDGSYYLLVGAACDIIIRSNGKRKKDILYLIKGEAVNDFTSEKVRYYQENNHQYIELSNFYKDGYSRAVKFDLNDVLAVDGYYLDLCCFNSSGEFKLPCDNVYFTSGQQKRYTLIEEQVQSIKSIYDNLNDENSNRFIQLQDKLMKTFRYEVIENNFSYFDDSKRITRVKKCYMEYINQLYSNIVGRIGYNTISMNPFERVQLTCICKADEEHKSISAIYKRKHGKARLEDTSFEVKCKDLTDAFNITEHKDGTIDLKEGKAVKLGKNSFRLDESVITLENKGD